MPLDIPLPTATAQDDPEQYIPLLLSATEGFLQLKEVWAEADYEQAYRYMEALKQYIVDCFGKCNDPVTYPIQSTIAPVTAWLDGGAALTHTLSASVLNNYFTEVTPIAINNAMGFDVLLDTGIYEMNIIGLTGTNFGQVSVYENGSPISGESDWYHNPAQANQQKTVSFSFATPDKHHLVLKVASKNASSSNYRFCPSAIWINRVGIP